MKNRITSYDDFATGQKVWFFYKLEKSKPEVCEGIIEGVIVDFHGYALDMVELVVYDKGELIKVVLRAGNLNHTEGEEGYIG